MYVVFVYLHHCSLIFCYLQIAKFAEDILLLILKCKILVNENIWNCVVEALVPTIPILLCHAGKNDALGRVLIGILDPDKASDLYIASLEVSTICVHIFLRIHFVWVCK